MTQATSGQQPTYQTNELNGLPVVRFDGGDILSCSDNLANSGVFTLFAVAKVDATGLRSILDRDGSTAPRIFQFRRFGDNLDLIAFNSSGTVAFVDSQPLPTSVWAVLTGVRRAAAVQAYVNGASNGATAADTVNMTGTHPTYMGGFRDNNGNVIHPNLVGDIAEVIMYDVDLSDTDREAVEGYLAAKYGLTLG
ncbi:MAG TPA: LamG-like jellyroll fold domain-containing protein [Trueperaceae bacterium]